MQPIVGLAFWGIYPSSGSSWAGPPVVLQCVAKNTKDVAVLISVILGREIRKQPKHTSEENNLHIMRSSLHWEDSIKCASAIVHPTAVPLETYHH
jgi:hypothetical protein